MEFTAQQIAQFINGQVDGDANATVHTVAKIEEGMPGALSFLANPKYTPYIYQTKSSVVIVNNDFVAENPIKATLIRVPDAYTAFARLLEIYNKSDNENQGVSSLAFIAQNASLDSEVYVGEFAYVGERVIIGKGAKIYPQVYIGNDCVVNEGAVLYPGVKLYNNTIIGKRCILHAGTVVGSDGFGFAPQPDGTYRKVPQTGNVIIEDDVEIGANTTIDRATLGSTVIRRGVKLDNLIQVAHNVEIGEHTVIAAQTGISGSTRLGSRCMIGGQVGLAGHLNIADETKLGAQSGVGSNIKEKGQLLIGTPAIPIGDFKRVHVHFKNLDEMAKRLRLLEERINQFESGRENRS
ncbi:MAG TPA: UDP-3-O-(3-hydroxymyristoyl)glucosamine N-acyltransferase [Bacteroidales bacterium]|nr:UDP-3-O-(3-hydroxymyristoyl)glucosamine N-acyltransferase [Bacteroidales bacterium]